MSKENNLTDFLTDLASAIKDKRGIGSVNAQDFSTEIRAIEPLLDTINITENGLHDVKNYKNASVVVGGEHLQNLIHFIERPNNNFNIPYGVTIIGERLFAQANDSNITVNLTFEDKSSIKKISKYAFQNNSTIPNNLVDFENVEEIGDYAFSYNSGSQFHVLGYQINFPKLKKIGQNVFLNRGYDSGMSTYGFFQNLDFPELVEISSNAFRTLRINSINFPKINKLPDYCFGLCIFSENFVLPQEITELGASCFTSAKLNEIDLSNVNVLGKNCFYYSTITKVKLNENLTEIPDTCFRECTKLTNIIIPKNVEKIGTMALTIGNSYNKATIIIENTTPPTISTNTFSANFINRIYVPKGTSATYKSATNWSAFSHLIYDPINLLFTIPTELVNNETITYSIDGGKTYQQFTNSVLSLNEVATIKIKSTDSSQTILIGTSAGGNDVGTISNSELTFSFTTDTNVYLTIQ